MRTRLILILLLVQLTGCVPVSDSVVTSRPTESVDGLISTPTPLSTLEPTWTLVPLPTKTLQPMLEFQTYDLRWCLPDKTGDVTAPYIDVVKVDAIAKGDTLIAKFFIKNIPESLTFYRNGAHPYHVEYSWNIVIDVDGNVNDNSFEYDDFIDYKLSILNFVLPKDVTTALPLLDGTQQNVWKMAMTKGVWKTADDAIAKMDTTTSTLTIEGKIPGLSPKSKIGFTTYDYNPGGEEQEDKPDLHSVVPPNTACSGQ